MLSTNVPATPRPRPPAQNRRSASLQFKTSPPPPYAAGFPSRPRATPLDTILHSTSTPDIHAHSPRSSSDVEEASWIKEKSREELSDLLTKADDIIREREHELTLTTAVCKSLYENNVTLKTRHKALLAVIPGTPNSSGMDFPSLPGSPSSYFTSLPRSAADSLGPGFQPPPVLRRTRKISVSPADIALLSDQNAELMQKLEKLESESAQADHVGRRALKKLEKELQVLREELEKTQAKSEELEEKARTGFGKGAEKVVEEAWRKKKEREARFRALRGRGEHVDGGGDVRDFAPASGLPSANWSDHLSPSRYSHYRTDGVTPSEIDSNLPAAPSSAPGYDGRDGDELAQLYSPSPRDDLMPTLPAPPQEYALISQFLLKIQELEETNAQIKQQQAETVINLQSVQRETENITRLYECLGDPASVEWVVDEEQQGKEQQAKKVKEDDTIRFRSLRRTLEGDLARAMTTTGDGTDVFGGGIAVKHHNTFSEAFSLNLNAAKTRKSVVGLFDSTPEPADQKPAKKRSVSTIPPPPIAFPVDRSCSNELNSPALSELGLTTPLHTLGSELGSEFGEDWGTNAGNHHLRTTSLGDLTDVSQLSPSPAPAAPFSFTPTSEDTMGSRTPVSIGRTGLQLTLETPTPTPDRSKAPQVGAQRGQHTPRYQRMSQTIHSRTKRWVDGRFKDTLVGLKGDEAEGKADAAGPQPTPLSGRITTALETFIGRGVDNGAEAPRDDVDLSTATEPHPGDTPKRSGKREKRAVVAFVVEVWLWLQFVIIVMVFLWAMAKRGPKTVLKDADSRRRTKRSGL